MKATTKILTGAAGLALAAGAFAAPAAAQYYPYGGYGGNIGDVIVGAVVNSVLGGNRYGTYGNYGYGNYGYANDQQLVGQCARAAEQRVANQYRTGGARVLQVTRVDRTSNGLRVRGVMTSGYYQQPYGGTYGGYQQPYGGYQQPYGYGYGNQVAADLRFDCRVDARGYVRDMDIDRQRTATYRY